MHLVTRKDKIRQLASANIRFETQKKEQENLLLTAEVRQVTMDFSYAQLGGVPSGDAYARLIDDCIQGDPTLFTRSDAVEASWKFFDPVLRYWKENSDAPLYGYPAGTWGPLESEAMMHEHGADWTNPCKNLTNTDQYCEL